MSTEETGFGEELDDETVQRLAEALADPAEQVAGLQLAVLDRAVERMRAAEGTVARVTSFATELATGTHPSLGGTFAAGIGQRILAIIDGEMEGNRG